MTSPTQPLLQATIRRRAPARSSRVPLLVLVLMVAFSTFATWFVWWNSRGHQEQAFVRSCEVVRMQIRSALQTYLAFLRGGAGLFAASERVSTDEFERYVERLRIPEDVSGIQGFGYSVVVRPENAAEILRIGREEVAPEYAFWGDGEVVEHHAVLFLEPRTERNKRALGYNMHANPIRREAMDAARDSGHPTASKAVFLKQELRGEPQQAGFLIYVPVYQNGEVPETVEGRREKLEGFVYAAFRGEDFMNAATRANRLPHLGFEVRDLAEDGMLLFKHEQTHGKRGALRMQTGLGWADHEWNLSFSGDANLGLAAPHIIVPVVGGMGLALSILFWLVTSRITAARGEAEENAELAAQGQHLFERIAEAMPGVLYVHDAVQGKNIYVNRQVSVILGLGPEDVQAFATEWDVHLMHPDDRAGAAEYLKAIGRLNDGEILTHEARFRHVDGSYRWLLLRSCVFTRGKDGDVQHILGVGSDITERRDTEEALRAANSAKDDFLAALSHELRTPLTPVLAVVSGLEEEPSLPQHMRADLAMARRNVELEARLIDDLLDLTRVARGKLILHLEPVNLREVIEHATTSVVEFREKGIKFKLEWQATECNVLADRSRLVQVFWNILKNAGKFTHLGGHVWLRVRNESAGAGKRPALVVECVDEGIGIPKETLPRIFTAFEQGDSRVTRQFGGLGLGLAICKKVVELHDGELHAASEGSGRGSTFTVRFQTIPGACSEPVAPQSPGDSHGSEYEANQRKTAAVDLRSGEGGLHLLLVEDHRDTAEILGKRLRRLGHRVTHAGSVAAALQFAEEANSEQHPFDLVLSDLGLPDGTGYELMRLLKERYCLRGIALSGFGMDADVRRSMEAGFSRHLIKPVDFDILKQAIAEVHRQDAGQAALVAP